MAELDVVLESPAMNETPLDDLIEKLNGGDFAAAERVFETFEPFLRMAVSRQLNGPLRAKVDSMDIVQAVWTDVLVGFRESAWRFADRGQLRAFLMTLARNRLVDRRRQFRQALERERPLDDADSSVLPATSQPRPSEIAQGHELWYQMLEQCPPAHRDLLRFKRQGLPLAEIAAKTGLHEGSVRRILYDLARRMAKLGETTSDNVR
jgi:RNA polymerase sigma factor (sigma-70 family)